MRSILAMVLLSGCALGEDTYYIDPQGTQAFNDAALEMAQMWTDVGCPIEEARGSQHGVPVMRVVEWNPALNGYQGFFDGHKIDIRSDYTVDAYLQKRIMLHEMGHMMGFEHRTWGIMRPTVVDDHVTVNDCTGEPPPEAQE